MNSARAFLRCVRAGSAGGEPSIAASEASLINSPGPSGARALVPGSNGPCPVRVGSRADVVAAVAVAKSGVASLPKLAGASAPAAFFHRNMTAKRQFTTVTRFTRPKWAMKKWYTIQRIFVRSQISENFIGFSTVMHIAWLSVLMLLTAPAATAQQLPMPPELQGPCPRVEDVAKWLKNGFGEVPSNLGVSHSRSGFRGAAVLVYENPSTRAWTMIIVTPQGCSGLVAFGTGWSMVEMAGKPL